MCHMIKRIIWLSVCAAALVGLWLVTDMWQNLAGQAVYRITAADDGYLAKEINEVAVECEVSIGAFAMHDTWDGIRLYECAAYHPEAFGIVMVKGVPIAQTHIDSCSDVAMLNVETAMLISPSLDCIGQKISIDGTEYTIIGIYEVSVQADAFTYTSSASAIIPAGRSGGMRTWYVWIKAGEGNVFAYQQADNMLSSLHDGMDAGGYQAVNISGNVSAGIQRCRLMTLVALVILYAGAVRHTRTWRRIFAETVRSNFEDHYPLAALLRSVRPFARYMLPIIAACLIVMTFAAYCAANIYIGTGSLPAKLLDMGQWWDIMRQRIIDINTFGQLPVYAAILDSWLSRFAWCCGITAILSAAFSVSGGRKDRCDG